MLWRQSGSRGFSLIELLVAISIVGLVIAVTVPATQRFYESIQYRQAVRDVMTTLLAARYQAVNEGVAKDVVLDPATNRVTLSDRVMQLPQDLELTAHTAREVNRDDRAVIRFYPEGGSSGGDVDIVRATGVGARVTVDWLVGSVTQAAYEHE